MKATRPVPSNAGAGKGSIANIPVLWKGCPPAEVVGCLFATDETRGGHMQHQLGKKVDLAHRTLVMMRQGKTPPPQNHGEYTYKSPAAPTPPSASLGCA